MMLTKEEQLKICNDMIMDTTQEVMNLLFEATDKMEKTGLPPALAFEMLRSVGFAVTGSCLMFFPKDEDREKARKELVNHFSSYLSKAVEANKGMENAKKSSLILQ